MRRPLLVLLASLALPACHRYVPVELGEVRPDMAVRVRIADRPTSPPLEGSVVEIAPGGNGLVVLPEARTVYDDGPMSLAGSEIEVLERRELNQGRTALLVGGTALAGVGLILLIDGNAPSETPPPGGGIVFFRLPLGGFGGS